MVLLLHSVVILANSSTTAFLNDSKWSYLMLPVSFKWQSLKSILAVRTMFCMHFASTFCSSSNSVCKAFVVYILSLHPTCTDFNYNGCAKALRWHTTPLLLSSLFLICWKIGINLCKSFLACILDWILHMHCLHVCKEASDDTPRLPRLPFKSRFSPPFPKSCRARKWNLLMT